MFYQRKIHPSLKSHLDNKQITVLTGMRRTGKTTLVKQLLAEIDSDNKIYIDLERLDNREIFSEKNYDSVILSLSQLNIDFKRKAFIALDEIQLVPNIASVLKYLYDNYDIKFIATGSSSYYIKNHFTESLAGRKKIFELFPLDFGEYLIFREISFKSQDNGFENNFLPAEYERLKSYYEEYINFGGFPEVVLAQKNEEKKDLLSDIISSYINIDVASLADFRDQKNFYALIKLLASRVGSRIDYSKLSRMIGISRSTVMNYMDFLEKTYLLSRLPVISKSPDREIVKAQKFYFCDNGLIKVLAEISSGAKFENAIFAQLRQKGDLRYYALKTGREIDFILNNEIAFEVKESPAELDQNDLAELSSKAGLKKYHLIGRHKSPKFKDYIWGGSIV